MTEDRNKRIAEQIKTMIKEKGPATKELMNYYKETNRVQKLVLDTIKEKEKTIPEIAKETNLDSKIVLWHLTAMTKYGKAEYIPSKMGYMKYKATK